MPAELDGCDHPRVGVESREPALSEPDELVLPQELVEPASRDAGER
ncbi:hypothetical protein [Pseudoclavibacter sp. CFCC 11306]|nr:hypothetical protein [Pseudoclavibacter sp. CFCC 11306]